MSRELLELIEGVAALAHIASEYWEPQFDSLDDLDAFYVTLGGPITVKTIDNFGGVLN